ncbi:MAG: TonB-dependent receptor, partial [Gemmatimonadales bacterium]|nr:TonB-dependent receptor [Gemmatimonadales bacterium]
VGGLRWSVDGYYKRLTEIPVTVWSAVAQFTSQLGRADGKTLGADVRIEYVSPHIRGFLGYGYSWTLYEVSQRDFTTWFGKPVQSYHPPHDRRHQINALLSLDLGDFTASARWQFGSGLSFTRPLGFDEAFDFNVALHQVKSTVGTTRLLLDKPFTGRLPLVHRLDVSLERTFDVSFGKIVVQAGVINAYDRRNMFYYDLFTGRRLDQLPLAPYASVTLRGG